VGSYHLDTLAVVSKDVGSLEALQRDEKVEENGSELVCDAIRVSNDSEEEAGGAIESRTTRKNSAVAESVSAQSMSGEDGTVINGVDVAVCESTETTITLAPRDSSETVSNGSVVASGESDSNVELENGAEAAPEPPIRPKSKRRQSLEEDFVVRPLSSFEVRISKRFEDDWQTLDGAWKKWAVNAGQEMARFLNNLHEKEWETKILRVGKVKQYAPHVDHLVLDLDCRPFDMK